MLTLPGIDVPRLLAAIAQVETSGGKNNCPRHEPAYMPKGARFTIQGHMVTGTGAAWNPIVQKRWDVWGLPSSASWGIYQQLFHAAADQGYAGPPWGLMEKATAQHWAEKQLTWLYTRGADTVEKLADAWNSGTHRDGIVPTAYIAKVAQAYREGV